MCFSWLSFPFADAQFVYDHSFLLKKVLHKHRWNREFHSHIDISVTFIFGISIYLLYSQKWIIFLLLSATKFTPVFLLPVFQKTSKYTLHINLNFLRTEWKWKISYGDGWQWDGQLVWDLWVSNWVMNSTQLCDVILQLLVSFLTKMRSLQSIVIIQSLSCVWLSGTPWTTACQASLSFTISRSLPKLTSIESVMSSNHLIICHSLLLLPSIFPSIRLSI